MLCLPEIPSASNRGPDLGFASPRLNQPSCGVPAIASRTIQAWINRCPRRVAWECNQGVPGSDPQLPVSGLPRPCGTAYASGDEEVSQVHGESLRMCPGLGTPAGSREPRITVLPMRPSVTLTTSAPATWADFELNPRGPLPHCLRFTPPVARRRCKTHYRPARYVVGRAGFAPAGFR